MAQKVIRHDELQNGMRVWVQGYLFEVCNVRVLKDQKLMHDKTPAADVVRFEGRCCDASYDIANTGYNGGTYGARVDVPCTIEVEEEVVNG